MYFVEHRINGFKLFGTAENGMEVLIYSDPPPYQNRGEIVLDSTYMPDVPVSGITIKDPEDTQQILTLCEVFVYGKYHFAGFVLKKVVILLNFNFYFDDFSIYK